MKPLRRTPTTHFAQFTIPARIFLAAGVSTLMALKSLAAGDTNNTPFCDGVCRRDIPSPWSIEVGSGTLFGNVRDSNLDSYTIVPATLGISRSFDRVYLQKFADGAFRGQFELLLDGYYTAVTSGTENYLTGFHIGARYDFISHGKGLVPFAETTVGAAYADARQFYTSDNHAHGLGQDFNFNFTIGTGVRYDFNQRYFARLTLQYTHYSNGGLSEPQHTNKAIDCAGPLLSIGFRF